LAFWLSRESKPHRFSSKPNSSPTKVAEAGEYKVWVRTIDWTKRLERPESAGRFKVAVNGVELETELGKNDTKWTWQLAGKTQLKSKRPTEPLL
jgi:hypothetical protein